MTDEVFTWDAAANNRMMLAGQGSLALNAISITRTGENEKIAVADNIWLAKAAKGPVRRMGLEHVMDVYVIWKFAENIDRQAVSGGLYWEFPAGFRGERVLQFPVLYPDCV